MIVSSYHTYAPGDVFLVGDPPKLGVVEREASFDEYFREPRFRELFADADKVAVGLKATIEGRHFYSIRMDHAE